MARGFVFLTAVLDWHNRRVLAHRLSITMEADFCIQALQEAIARYGKPQICHAVLLLPARAARELREVTIHLRWQF